MPHNTWVTLPNGLQVHHSSGANENVWWTRKPLACGAIGPLRDLVVWVGDGEHAAKTADPLG